MKTKHLLFLIMALMVCMTSNAQSADKMYKEAKALYDAKNYTEALPLLKKAADKGHKKAQYRLGRCYDKGHGVAEDNSVAFQWYQKSAAQDYAKAQYALGRCYLKGKAVAVDRNKAKSLLKKAVKNEKGGDKVLEEIKQKVKEGDETAKTILNLIKEK